jgi:hypothetical protein
LGSKTGKPPSEQLKSMVLNGLTRCCTAFDAKFSEELYELFVERLARFTPEQVGAAFALAIDECERMPRLKHILARIEQSRSLPERLDVKITEIRRESFDDAHDLKVWVTDSGARFVRIVARDPFALPEKAHVPMSQADKLNFEQQMKAAASHMKIPYVTLSDKEIEQRRQDQIHRLAEHLKSHPDLTSGPPKAVIPPFEPL